MVVCREKWCEAPFYVPRNPNNEHGDVHHSTSSRRSGEVLSTVLMAGDGVWCWSPEKKGGSDRRDLQRDPPHQRLEFSEEKEGTPSTVLSAKALSQASDMLQEFDENKTRLGEGDVDILENSHGIGSDLNLTNIILSPVQENHVILVGPRRLWVSLVPPPCGSHVACLAALLPPVVGWSVGLKLGQRAFL